MGKLETGLRSSGGRTLKSQEQFSEYLKALLVAETQPLDSAVTLSCLSAQDLRLKDFPIVAVAQSLPINVQPRTANQNTLLHVGSWCDDPLLADKVGREPQPKSKITG